MTDQRQREPSGSGDLDRRSLQMRGCFQVWAALQRFADISEKRRGRLPKVCSWACQARPTAGTRNRNGAHTGRSADILAPLPTLEVRLSALEDR